MDLSGIEVIEQDRVFVAQARVKVRNYAEKILDHSIQTNNPSNIAMALLVFYRVFLKVAHFCTFYFEIACYADGSCYFLNV